MPSALAGQNDLGHTSAMEPQRLYLDDLSVGQKFESRPHHLDAGAALDSLVYYTYNTQGKEKNMLDTPQAKRAAIGAAIGAVVAIPLPFVGPILGAIVGGGIGFFTAPQR
ncbi:MAG: hypothetical protein V4513_08385 [Pseudomonadota bacterium]